jgi:perosamine synthetase
MQIKIPLSVPSFRGNEKRYVESAVESTWVSTGGSRVAEFEMKIASYNGVKNGVACSSGTAALHAALIECGVEEGDEVIVPTVTFIAPVNAVRYLSAVPVFMDCDDHLNIDCSKVEEFLCRECVLKGHSAINRSTNRRVKAIIPVHVFGHPVDMEQLVPLAEKFRLSVIEDATESLGSYYRTGTLKGRKTGAVGRFGCYSFNGNKIITTGGGGMIVMDDKKAARHLKYLTTQAKDDELYYIHNEIGYNYRMTNLQAALGLAQLESLDAYIAIKRENFRKYVGLLEGRRGLSFIEEPPYGFSNYWMYALVVDDELYGVPRDVLLKKLLAAGIEARPLWHLCHAQRPYAGFQAYRIEKALRFQREVLNVPCSVGITEEEIKTVVEWIKR